jgi:hypothetical protein
MADFDRDISGQQDAIDILKITQDAYPWRGELTVLQDRHDYPVMNRWFGQDKMVVMGGPSVSKDIMIDENGSAEWVVPYQRTEPNVVDVMAKIIMPWRNVQAYYAIEVSEVLRNRGNSQKLVDILKVRRASAALSLAEQFEKKAWLAPTSTSDNLHPAGIPYWIVPITAAQVAAHLAASESYGAHQGANPTGFSDCAGLDASTDKYHLWRNWNDIWDGDVSNVTEADVQRIVRMHRHLQFRVPMNATDWASDTYSNYRAYCSEDRLDAFERKARSNNDSLGADLGKFSGAVVVKGTPIEWAEELDSRTDDPFYMINHKKFRPIVQEGMFLKESDPLVDVSQHKVTVTYVDCELNFFCENRRSGGGVITTDPT